MLELEEVNTYYGESRILQGISLRVERAECVALLGPNGMGKTTTLRTIMGLTPARSGEVRFKGRPITALPPFKIARMGIGYVPENRDLFDSLTVVENLMVPFLNFKQLSNKKWKETEQRIYALFPILSKRRQLLASSLSGGEQQMLATARAMISGEELMLLDEPTEGLAPVVIQDVVAALLKLQRQGKTMLLVEQNIETAMEMASRCYVLEKGRVKLEESVEILCKRPDLLHQYLGAADSH